MIPGHLIDQAAAAIYASSAFGDRFALDAWHDMADDNPVKTTTRMYARAALETVAADIWDDGYEARQDEEASARAEYGTTFTDVISNPYRASESA